MKEMCQLAVPRLSIVLFAVLLVGCDREKQESGSKESVVVAPPGTAKVKVPAERGEPLKSGDPASPVTMILFTDYVCPHCRELHDSILPELESRFVDKGELLIELRHLPEPVDDRSLLAARIVRLAGGGREVESLLFDWAFRKDFGTPESLSQLAAALDLDESSVTDLLKMDGTKDFKDDASLAEMVGLDSLPTAVFVPSVIAGPEGDGIRISGIDGLETYKKAVESLKMKAK